jgi:hypothetical protein
MMVTSMILMFVAGGFAGTGVVAAAQSRLEAAGVFILGAAVLAFFSILEAKGSI